MATSRLLPLGDGFYMVMGVRVSPRNGKYVVGSPERRYGIASTFEARRHAPGKSLADDKERLMSENNVVGKTRYEVLEAGTYAVAGAQPKVAARETAEVVGFRTESGAEYAVKDGKAQRLEGSPFSEGIDYDAVPDETWMDLATTVEVGGHVYMTRGFKFRQTTPVVEVYYG